MKLCFIANGSSIHTQRWIQPYIDQGDQVVVISYTPTGRTTFREHMIDLTKIVNVRKVRFLLWGVWVWRFVHEYRPEILHAHQIQAAGWLGSIANYHPFVVSAWGSDLLLEPLKSKLRLRMLRLVLDRCDRLIVPSQFMVDRAIELGISEPQVRMIPWGIETDIFNPRPVDRDATRSLLGFGSDRKVIFCPRGIQPLYQTHVLLKSLKNIRPEFPNIRCILLEFNISSEYLQTLKNMIQTYQLEDCVQWLPAQSSREDMARLYRASDVMVSIPNSEGYGFSVYESMACGCPTVITDLPVFQGELVNGLNTLSIPCGDVAATSQAIIELLKDPLLREKSLKTGLILLDKNPLPNR